MYLSICIIYLYSMYVFYLLLHFLNVQICDFLFMVIGHLGIFMMIFKCIKINQQLCVTILIPQTIT